MKILIYLLPILLISCSSKKVTPQEKEVCFLLYDLRTKEFTKTVNPDFCRQERPAASTFKIPLSLMAYDAKILKDDKEVFKWDKKKSSIYAWNKDQTPASWMKESVVWVSQLITPQLGVDKITEYLKSFNYGNADMSGGLQSAWLTPDPTKDAIGNTLKISAFDQVSFLEKLWLGELKVSKDAQESTVKLLPSETSPRHSIITGKTGSGLIGEEHNLRLGWYVGYVQAEGKNFVVVTNFVDREEKTGRSYGGPEARELTKKFLGEENLW